MRVLPGGTIVVSNKFAISSLFLAKTNEAAKDAYLAVSRDTRAAMFLGFGMMFAMTGVLSLAAALAYWSLKSSAVIWLLSPGPLLGFIGAFDARYQGSAGAAQYWVSILSMTGLGVLLLWITSVLLPLSWQDGHGEAAWASSNPRTGFPTWLYFCKPA